MKHTIWKNIPGYPNYEASDAGRVRKKDCVKNLKEFFYGDMKDPYLGVSIKRMDNTWMSIQLHILICLAFHGVPPHPAYIVNHKDGNKLNPLPDNLEWATQSENVIHAYATKLNRCSQHIKVTDLRTGDVINLRSINHFAQHFNLTDSFNKGIMSYNNQPWLGRYRIDLDSDYVQPKNNAWSIDVKDYYTNKVHVSISMMGASRRMGLLRKTIKRRVIIKSLALTNGCVVKSSLDERPWPIYTKQQINKSIADFKMTALKVKRIHSDLDCFDYRTNTLYVAVNFNFIEKELGIARQTVRNVVKRGILKLLTGIVIKRHDDPRSFPTITKEQIDRSISETQNRANGYLKRHK